MFVFGIIVGIGLTLAVLLLLRSADDHQESPALTTLLARRRIHDVEQAAITRMLAEAEVERRRPPRGAEVVDRRRS